jgi:hypothetical protein
MTPTTNRRQILRALLTTSITGMVPTSRHDGSSAEPTGRDSGHHDFASSRQRILEEIASGKATAGQWKPT